MAHIFWSSTVLPMPRSQEHEALLGARAVLEARLEVEEDPVAVDDLQRHETGGRAEWIAHGRPSGRFVIFHYIII